MRLLVATIVTWLALVASAMAVSAPVVANSSNGTAAGTASTTQSVTFPATVNAGDLLIDRLDTVGSVSGVTWPAGWTTFLTKINGSIESDYVYKTADGTEGGTTITVTSNGSSRGTYGTWDITGSDLAVAPQGIIQNGPASTTLTPPAITPAWGALPSLFVVNEVNYLGGNVSTFPSGYGSPVINHSVIAMYSGSASRRATVTTETPGSFTIASSPTDSITATFAVKPSTATPSTVINIPFLGM